MYMHSRDAKNPLKACIVIETYNVTNSRTQCHETIIASLRIVMIGRAYMVHWLAMGNGTLSNT